MTLCIKHSIGNPRRGSECSTCQLEKWHDQMTVIEKNQHINSAPQMSPYHTYGSDQTSIYPPSQIYYNRSEIVINKNDHISAAPTVTTHTGPVGFTWKNKQ